MLAHVTATAIQAMKADNFERTRRQPSRICSSITPARAKNSTAENIDAVDSLTLKSRRIFGENINRK